MTPGRRIALFGGTFDPVHNAHLVVARAAADRFALDQVLFIPASHPPHKYGSTFASYEHRYRMVELACAADRRFVPSRIEADDSKSYSIDTIEKVKASLHPNDVLYFLIGADAFAEITTWRRYKDVIAAVEFIVVTRPGHAYKTPPGAKVAELEGIAISVSSSAIRDRLADGVLPAEMPEAVATYIAENRLYGYRAR